MAPSEGGFGNRHPGDRNRRCRRADAARHARSPPLACCRRLGSLHFRTELDALASRALALCELDDQLGFYFSLSPTTEADRSGFLVTLMGLAEFAILFATLIGSSAACERSRWKLVSHAAVLTVIVGGLAICHGHMLWLTPFPPPLAVENNQFDCVMQIAERVQA